MKTGGHPLPKRLEVRRAAAGIDVPAVGLVGQDIHLGVEGSCRRDPPRPELVGDPPLALIDVGDQQSCPAAGQPSRHA